MTKRAKDTCIHVLLGTALFIFVIALWYIVTVGGFIKPFFLPQPIEVIRALSNLFLKHSFLKDIAISVIRISTGFLIATVLAIPLGIALGRSKYAQAIFEPMIDFIRYTPIPAFIPLFVLWFGIGELEKIIVIVAAVFFQLVLMVANSIARVPQHIIDFARTLGADRSTLMTKVIYQHAKPAIFDDMRVSMGLAWAGLMIAEIVGATSGIGFVIVQSQRLLRTANVIAAIIIVGVKGEREQIAEHYLTVTNLNDFAHYYPKDLSSGMQQRVAIARTLANNPKIILMDEPFGSLDAQTKMQMQQFLLETWEYERKTVLFVTHDIREAILLADTIYLLTPIPACIKKTFQVPFTRSRNRDIIFSSEFTNLEKHITAELSHV